MRPIEDLLRRHIGLDAASIGSSLLERIIRGRMKQHGVRKPEAYHDLLANSRSEWEQLVEAVVVTETWFFRDHEPFNAFTQLARHAWSARQPAGALRVLSLPCSTGEEPYSLVMALLDAGLPETAFAIEAADISANALARAEQAVYRKNSFRGRELGFRDRYFLPTKEGYVLSPHVRSCVTFERGNLLDDDFLVAAGRYDFIFCRNLLIYFDPAAQVFALAKLHRLLADDGVLFVGPAELPVVVASGFVTAGLPMAFACRKTPSHRVASREPDLRQPARLDALQSTLEAARQHADAGRLIQAATICNEHLAIAGPSAQAYYLLGLVSDASNDPAAITFYRKALYLEPNHYEALVQLTLALEKSGDRNAARIYQRRAERAQPKP